jgi:hypothetical protein
MMSSKIFQVYYLTEYSFGRTILIWPKSRFKAINANAVSTHGFHAKEMMRNPRFAQSANRRIGTLRASQTAKRQSADNMLQCKKANGFAVNETAGIGYGGGMGHSLYDLSITAGNGLLVTVHCPT